MLFNFYDILFTLVLCAASGNARQNITHPSEFSGSEVGNRYVTWLKHGGEGAGENCIYFNDKGALEAAADLSGKKGQGHLSQLSVDRSRDSSPLEGNQNVGKTGRKQLVYLETHTGECSGVSFLCKEGHIHSALTMAFCLE